LSSPKQWQATFGQLSTSTLVPCRTAPQAVAMTRRREPHQLADGTGTLATAAVAAAAAGLVLAFPVATWWLVGDLSTVPASASPDFAFRPFAIGHGAERAAGAGSALLAAVTMLTLAGATFRHLVDQRWWSVLAPLLAAGFVAGAGWRVMTAGVIGTNFGAGFVVIFGGPVVAALLVAALARAVHLLRRRVTRPTMSL
jgi:hypothetical protein